ncbi:MAG: winged helix-turn-helix transcriptional regulator [Micromonosporaceae bacterium]
MAGRDYGQFCGLARALDLVGERWALLIIRDLVQGPKRYTDLRKGLARIPTNVLSTRLKTLEAGGVVRRRRLPRPAAVMVYELTAYGSELEDVIMRLGLWGARLLGEPRPGEVITADSMIIGLRSTFQSQASPQPRVGYELRVGEIVVHVQVEDGGLRVAEGPLVDADLVITMDPGVSRALLSGELTPDAGVESGEVRLSGDAELLNLFVDLFHIPTEGAILTDGLSAIPADGAPAIPAQGFPARPDDRR